MEYSSQSMDSKQRPRRIARQVAEVYDLLANAEAHVHEWHWIAFADMHGFDDAHLYDLLVSRDCPVVHDPHSREVGLWVPAVRTAEICSDVRSIVFRYFGF
jgi:hypothetical protein